MNVEKINTVAIGLNESCKKILEYLIEKNGQETQRKMKTNVDMPRTTLAHNLNLLVERGIVKKTKYFYTNVVRFSDEFWN